MSSVKTAPTPLAPAPPSRRLGRFDLRRELGRGAQATVWLAFDARLEREVAVKLLHADAGADLVAVGHWLQEARSVSRLAHPHIVPVFEADLHLQQPYLVFEYVPGPTLAQRLASGGGMSPYEAVEMALGMLDALATAHAAGIVHRDLKPSNILVDAAGRARVMDFGIAARLDDPGPLDQIVGSPGYMSPEAANGGAPAATMDVFAAGLVLIEMLTGERVVAERDPYRAIARITSEDLVLPATLPSTVDDALRAVLRRAIERDPRARWPDATAFRDALQRWLAPPLPAADATPTAGTLEFLLRRMRHKTDFPAMSDAVARIQRVANSENESVGSLAAEILKDVALTHKLLRLVNTAHYSGGGGSVSTVSRAITMIGFAGVRNMSISLVMLEHMQDKAHASRLKEEFLRALMAGMLAGEIGAASREEAFIGAMFQNLGRLLTEFYFPEEADQVRARVAVQRARSGAPDDAEELAAIAVLGLCYADLGIGVAKSWGLPPNLQACMRPPAIDPPEHMARDANERLRWLTHASNRITDVILHTDPARCGAKVLELARTYAGCLGTTATDIEAATKVARQRLLQTARAMNLVVGPQSPARRLLGGVVDAQEKSALPLTATMTLVQARPAPDPSRSEVLAAGIQDITNSMADDVKLNDVLRMILETMYRGLAFQRVIFCLRDAKSETLTGRFGLGNGVEGAAAGFAVPLRGTLDLFSAACLKGADTLIGDATLPATASRLPGWYRQKVNAPAFLLLPLLIKGAPFGLIYADASRPGGITLGEREMSLLRTLRNQAVMAFKQLR